MKTPRKRVAKKYRDMTQREREKLPLLERYRQYFNEYRDAGIEIIGSASTADPTNRELRVRYEDGHEVVLPDVLKWMDLFNELNQMHPKKKL